MTPKNTPAMSAPIRISMSGVILPKSLPSKPSSDMATIQTTINEIIARRICAFK